MKKQILGVLIVVIILMSMLPTTVFAEETTNYDIWVEGKQVTSANQSNVLSKTGFNGATVTYDPTTNTLTLDYAALKSSNGTYNAYGSYYVIYFGEASPANPILKVNGICSIAAESSDKTIIGIGASRVKLTIQKATSSSTLGIDVKSEKEYNHGSSAYGIQGGNQLIFDGANVSVVVDGTARLTNGIFVSDYSSPVVTVKNGAYLSLSASGTGSENYALNYNGGGKLSIDDTSTAIFQSDDESCLSTSISLNKDSNGNYTQIILADANRDGVMEAHTSKPINPYASRIEIRPAVKATLDLSSAGIVNKEAYWAKDVVFPEPEAPVVKGYVFAGWYTNSSYTTAFDFSTKKSTNFTIYAKYIPYDADMQKIRDAIEVAKSDLQTKIDNVNSALADQATNLAQAITDLNTAKTNIQTLLEQIDDYADADELKKYIDDADTAIRTSIDALTARVAEIEDKLDGITLTQIATNQTNIANLTTTLNEVKNTVDALDNTFVNNTELTNALADLKGELKSADATLEGLITALTGRVEDIENALDGIDLTQIATNKQDIANLTGELGDLNTLVNTIKTNYISADANLQTQIANLQTAINAAVNRIAALEGRVTDLETAKQELEKAVTDLKTALNDKVSTAKLTEEIGKLNVAITAAQNYANTQDAALKDAIEGADSVLNTAIDALEDRVSAIEKQIKGINLSQIAENKTNIESLTDGLNAVKNTVAALDDTFVNNTELTNALADLKGELKSADATLEGLITALTGRVDVIESKLAGMDLTQIAKNETSIKSLTEELGKLNTFAKDIETNYKSADAALQAQITVLDTKLTKLIDETIAELTKSVNKLKNDLDTANGNISTNTTNINTLQNQVSDLEAKQTEAQAAIDALEDLTGTQGALQTAIADLKAAVDKANSNIDAALIKIFALEGNVKELKATLEKDIKDLQDAVADKADGATTTDALQKLEKTIAALELVKDNYITADEKLKDDLNSLITKAKIDAIDVASDLVNTAKADLEDKLKDKADADTTAVAIKKLEDAIANLESIMDNYIATDSALSQDLAGKIDDAKGTLETAIKKLEDKLKEENASLNAAINQLAGDLSKAQKELSDAITRGDAALSSYIDSVSTSLRSAKATLEQADKDNKAALEAKIKVAEATLDAAIQAVQKNLDDAKAELNQAIENGNAELDSKIANLNAALESTKAALEAADETNKLDLEAALSDAYNSITEAYKKAIGEAQEELEAKVNANIDATAKELAANTNSARNVAITATVVGSIALVSNIALVSWFIKKKRLF